MASFGVTAKMDIDTLQQVLDLREKKGFHVDYKYGLQVSKDWVFKLPEPFYDGLTLRIFIYNKNPSNAKLRLQFSANYWLLLELKKPGNVEALYFHGQTRKQFKDQPNVQAKTFFSFGITMLLGDIDYFVMHCNRWKSAPFSIRHIDNSGPWSTTINSGSNYIVSLHLCQETRTDFPRKGLGNGYDIPGLVLPIGSYLTMTVFFSGAYSTEEIKIAFLRKTEVHELPPIEVEAYLAPGDQFTLIVRNTHRGWLVTADFLKDNQNENLVPHPNGFDKKTTVRLSPNCTVWRILATCGVIQAEYREPSKQM